MQKKANRNAAVVSFTISEPLRNKMDEHWREKGFMSRSDYLSFVIRNAIEPMAKGIKK